MLTRSTEYAIRALISIQTRNREDKRPGVVEIARGIEAPEAFIAKILHTLTRHRMLGSLKGRGGGFFFDNKVSDLSVYDVILLMEGDALFYKCVLGLKHCDGTNPCPLHYKYVVIRDSFLDMARNETINFLSKRTIDENSMLRRLV